MHWPKPRQICSLCQIRPPEPAKIYFCARCNRKINQAIRKALVTTAAGLLPELMALLVILAVLPTYGQSNYWLVIPVVALAVPRIRYIFVRTANRAVNQYINDSGIPQVWSAEFEIKHARESAAHVRNAIRHEAIALAIPLTPQLEKVLNGEIHQRELSDRDMDLIWPAVEAAMKRERDKQAALGIEAALPRGDDPTC